mmetsp:Transcript_15807/g.25777  ORF Transcript_15807/g.25777 Transcript_15807/m.25777 type:complete len:279 (+) Transcript_15807:240-1076(+)|eukprot:jgi/Bigna1/41202/e_gw1.50.64.1
MKEQGLLEGRAPESAQEYERLVVASPNSSIVWIKYIAYFVSLAEISKARQIAERALKAISFREEKEKLNVWTAWLNLENMYGTEESLERVRREAVQFCEPLQIHTRMARIFEDTKKYEKAEAQHKMLCRKFRQSAKAWTDFAAFLFRRSRGSETRALMEEGLKVLPRVDHVKLITKFGQMEYSIGSAERGRTIFDNVVANYPKRVDVWSVYIDMEVKHGDQESVRRIMARATNLNLSTKKMKFLFTKCLDYEKEHGTEESANAIKEKAREYIQNKANA